MIKQSALAYGVAASLACMAGQAGEVNVPFPGTWQKFGRVEVQATTGGVTIANGLMADMAPRGDCEVNFRARMPESAGQVQIWSAVRVHDRLSRYVVGLRGGLDPQLSLARYAPDGQSQFLRCVTLRDAPQPGTWYRLRIAVAGQRFQVYFNDEPLPRINIEDKTPLWNDGGVALGGGWLPAEFADLTVLPLAGDKLAQFKAAGQKTFCVPCPDREGARVTQRAAYRPATCSSLPELRGEFSLDGKWLFMPDQALPAGARPDAPAFPDQDWHIIPVPSMWTPTLPWLHGEATKPGRDGNDTDRSPSDKLLSAEYDRVNAQTFDWEKTKSGWYRHYLELPANLDGRRFELVFDAVAKISDVYVNGVPVGANTGMFREVHCDITPAVKPGKNLVAVHVIGVPPSRVKNANKVQAVAVTVEVTSEMLNSLPHGIMNNDVSGIWQPVHLVVTDPVRVDSVFVKPQRDGATLEAELANAGVSVRSVDVSYEIRDSRDGALLVASREPAVLSIPAGGKASTILQTPKLQPKLWSPQAPNLYTLELTVKSGGRTLDRHTTRFGFRTFETVGNRLFLNGKPWFIRGANHFPNTLRPNDRDLARTFIANAREGNVWATRSVCMPFTRAWLDAADELGMGVSQEGTWSWLMLPPEAGGSNKDSLPDARLLAVWKSEFSDLIRQWRNHPSVLMWTVNNEMKFYHSQETPPELLKQKWAVLDDMIRTMRRLDPTRPIVPDSGYMRKNSEAASGRIRRENNFDDGDIDDAHRYYGWYNPSFFHLFKGQFGKDGATPGRPFISQEWGGGYPRDDGWAVRSYQFRRYVPQALVGDYAMEGNDPSIFLKRQALLTKELTETVRRTNRDEVAGLMPFAYITWFTEVWDAARLKPALHYHEVSKALQPVLVSAELYGRHFYAGDRITRRVCIVNDADEREALPAGTLDWEVRQGDTVLARGTQPTPMVPYYSNQWLEVPFQMPAPLPQPRVDGKLSLSLTAGGRVVGCNDYDILLASHEWAKPVGPLAVRIPVFDPSGKSQASLEGWKIQSVPSLDALEGLKALVVGDLEAVRKSSDGAAKLRRFIEAGGRVLMLNPGKDLVSLFPEYIKSYRLVSRERFAEGRDVGEIVSMQIPESPVFDSLEPLDLAWFEMGPGNIPRACAATYEVDRSRPEVATLAHQCMIHPAVPAGRFFSIAGAPIVELRPGRGLVLASEMMVEAQKRDPVASRLLANMIACILD